MRKQITASFLGWTFLLLLLGVSTAWAQDRTISGTVTDEAGEAMIAVNVGVKGTTLGTITDINGKFSLKVPESAKTLIFSFVGYDTEEVEIGTQTTIAVTLKENLSTLDEVVITGLASSVKRSNLANSVASIDASALAGTTQQQTLDGALYGKFKGANIVANSGAPGGGASIKLRGITSITGNSQPLYIVDGVYIDNSAIPSGLNIVSAAAAGGSASNQDNPSNRIADLAPEDIESIEILKGASAASIYGSRSAAGVVVIRTKRGKPGRTNVSFDQNIGFTTILNPLGQREWTEQRVRDVFDNDQSVVDDFNANPIRNYEDELYGNTGLLRNTSLSVSGGNQKTRYYASVHNKDEEAIVKNTGYKRTSLRLNLTHDITDGLELAMTTNYINSSADRGFFNNDNSGTTMGISYVSTPPWADLFPDAAGNYPNNPYAPSNFLQTRDLVTNNETVNRFIGGATLTAKLQQSETSQLKLIGTVGIDRYTLSTRAIFPKELQFQKNGNGLDGVSIQGNTVVENLNAQAFLVHNYYPNEKLSMTSQLGVLYLDFNRNTILTTGANLIGTQTNLDQAGSISVAQDRQPEQDFGFFIQEEINYDDKFLLTLGLRADKSSNNSDANKLYYYPKANAAVNLHNFGSIGSGALSQLKVRLAYGQAGRFANFGSTFTSLGSTIIGGQPGALLNSLRGNANVGPERQSEIELGFDLGFLKDRLTFDFTYYRKNVTDLLLNAQVPNSSGFSARVINGAELQNQGIEMGLTYNALNKQDISWVTGLNFWLNRSKVTNLEVPAFNTGAFGATLGTFRIEEGKSATQIVGISPDGLQVFGDAEPDFQLSWNNTLKVKNFDLSFLFHWKQGAENVNLSTLLLDLNGTTHDYDATTLDPEGVLSNGDYRLSQLGTSAAVFVEDASYIRLREVGLFYNVSKDALAGFLGGAFQGVRVGVSGYNLLNFFSYNSYDPEVSNFGGGGLSTGVEVTPFPSAKRVYFHLGLKF